MMHGKKSIICQLAGILDFRLNLATWQKNSKWLKYVFFIFYLPFCFVSFCFWWKNYEISLLGSSMVMKNCEGCLNVFNLQNPVYSQIWLNCLLDDHHFSYIKIKKIKIKF